MNSLPNLLINVYTSLSMLETKFWQHLPFWRVTLKIHSPGVIFTGPERCSTPPPQNSPEWFTIDHMFFQYLVIMDAQLAISCWAFLFWFLYEMPLLCVTARKQCFILSIHETSSWASQKIKKRLKESTRKFSFRDILAKMKNKNLA